MLGSLLELERRPALGSLCAAGMNQVLETVERIHPVPPPLSLPLLLCNFSAMAVQTFLCKPCKRMGSMLPGVENLWPFIGFPALASVDQRVAIVAWQRASAAVEAACRRMRSTRTTTTTGPIGPLAASSGRPNVAAAAPRTAALCTAARWCRIRALRALVAYLIGLLRPPVVFLARASDVATASAPRAVCTRTRFDRGGAAIAGAAGVREEVAKEALQEHRKQSETNEEESEPARLKRVEELLEELLVMGEAQARPDPKPWPEPAAATTLDAAP